MSDKLTTNCNHPIMHYGGQWARTYPRWQLSERVFLRCKFRRISSLVWTRVIDVPVLAAIMTEVTLVTLVTLVSYH